MGAFLKAAPALAMVAVMPWLTTTESEAATLTFGPSTFDYSESDPRPSWNVVVDDLTAGFFRITVSIATGSTGIADILGIGFDTALEGLALADLTFVSSPTGDGITGLFGNGTNNEEDCGGGCRFNGTHEKFDYIVRVGDEGTASGLNTSFVFLIANTAALALSDTTFTQFGIRCQGLGAGPGAGRGSCKDFTDEAGTFDEDLPIVPLPASALLLLSGLFGLGGLGYASRSGLKTVS
jgi:hypothetical protein